MQQPQDDAIEVHPLTPERWDDMEALFRSAAIPGRCWCQWWRRTQSEAIRERGEGNRAALQAQVKAGQSTGMLAYLDGQAVGWCSVSPRASFGRLARSAALTPASDPPPDGTWSTVCFFVHRRYRHRSVAKALLRAAMEFAREQGAVAFEGYPVRPREGKLDNNSAFPGTWSMFVECGFEEVQSKAPGRSIQAIMRRRLA